MKKGTNVIITAVSKDFFPRHEVITAIKWNSGCKTTEAKKIYAETSAEYHNHVVAGFRMNAKKAFAMD